MDEDFKPLTEYVTVASRSRDERISSLEAELAKLRFVLTLRDERIEKLKSLLRRWQHSYLITRFDNALALEALKEE